MASEVTRFEFNRQEFVRYSDYAELEAKLAALDWTPITPDNLPKVGDEVYSHWGKQARSITESILKTYGDDYRVWVQYAYTHRRPINPPQEPS